MNRKTRLIALALAAAVLLFAFTAMAFVFHGHSDCDDDCPICAAISFCRNVLNAVCAVFAVFSVSLFFAAVTCKTAKINRTVSPTPVILKVKMTD